MFSNVLRAGSRPATANRLVFEDAVPESLKILDEIDHDITKVSPRFAELSNSLRHFAANKLSDRQNIVIGVSSAGPGEGRTTVSLILASALADIRGNVLYVEMSQPGRGSLQEETAYVPSAGLERILRSETSLGESVLVSGRQGLSILPSGTRESGSPSMQRITRLRSLLGVLRSTFDVTIVDLPPLLASEDAAGVIGSIDGIVMVVATGCTSLPDVQRAVDLCGDLPIEGIIMNRSTRKAPRWLSGMFTSEGQRGLA